MLQRGIVTRITLQSTPMHEKRAARAAAAKAGL
jgi:hypothetical protein